LNDLHLVVGLAGGRYAVPVTSVREVIRTSRLAPIPGAPPAVLGIANLRGEMLAILDAATLLGLARGPRAESIAVVKAGDVSAGLAVGELFDVVSLPLGLDPADTPALRGSARLNGELLGVIDVPALLGLVGSEAPR
jgi:purine-binding chemotaxis protein CheW